MVEPTGVKCGALSGFSVAICVVAMIQNLPFGNYPNPPKSKIITVVISSKLMELEAYILSQS